MYKYSCKLMCVVIGCLSFLIQSSASGVSQDKKFINQLNSSLKTQNYDEADRIIRDSIDSKISLKKIKKLGKKERLNSLVNAARATNKIYLKNKDLGILKSDILHDTFFIETKLGADPRLQNADHKPQEWSDVRAQLANGKSVYLQKDKTGLAHPIECDGATKTCYIVLDGKGTFIGHGKNKIVRKAIIYDAHKPKIVARAEERNTSERELKITKMLHGSRGIFDTLGFTTRKENGEKFITIFSKLYQPGTMKNALKNRYKFSMREKMQMALNLLYGLEAMHTKGIVHRDLGAKNMLINIPRGKVGKRRIEACIADLGRANFVYKVRQNTRVQGNSTYTAPEGLYVERIRGDLHYQCDIFAVGCVFYWIFHGKQPAWQDTSYVKDTTRPLDTRYQELVDRINHETLARRQKLEAKYGKGKISAREEFEYLMLYMLHPDYQMRGTASDLRQWMEQIAKKA